MSQLPCGGVKISPCVCLGCIYIRIYVLGGLTGCGRPAVPVRRLGQGVYNSGTQCVTTHPAAALAKPTASGHKTTENLEQRSRLAKAGKEQLEGPSH